MATTHDQGEDMLPTGRTVEAQPWSASGINTVFGAAAWRIPLESTLRQGVFAGLFDLRQWSRWLTDAQRLLSPDEQQRVASRRVCQDREDLALAYALHRLLLGRVLQCMPQAVPLYRDALGCPRLQRRALFTSLSHAGRAVAVAVSGAGDIGVDLESRQRANVMTELAERVCHPDDAMPRHVNRQIELEAMLALWVRKEAVLKAAGIGLQVEMNTFSAPDTAVLTLPTGGVSQVTMLGVGDEWFAAISCPPGTAIECAWLRPFEPA